MGGIVKTRDHNLHIITENGFKKFSNTTVFHQGRVSLISPAVAENISGTYWFDLRKVNIERLSNEAYLLVRIVPNLFIFEPIESIKNLISYEIMDNRPKSGDVWGIKINLNVVDMEAELYNLKAPRQKIPVKLLSVDDIIERLNILYLSSKKESI